MLRGIGGYLGCILCQKRLRLLSRNVDECTPLVGGLVSGVQLAISASNTGGAWDNAKKFVEKGGLFIDMPKRDEVTGEVIRNVDGTTVLVSVRQRKGSECHKAGLTLNPHPKP